ncbi:MAG TPA: glycerophosphodiester phosphodiesterase, partial [Magnetospirillaceae bacterium]|nr:glycerophosphodiester phosphodiesterase [Magnetospirillaceae bacterium]
MARVPLFPDFPRPLVFAHRGLSAEAPENTRAAFALARKLGVPGAELDIQICASGELVVFHDFSTGRVAGVDFDVGSTPWKLLRDLDVGAWKGPEWKGEGIPLLADILDEFGLDFYWDIEVKGRDAADRGLEAALARLLDAPRLKGRVAVSSFNPASVRRFKGLSPVIPTAIIWCRSPELKWYLRRGHGRWIARPDFLKPSKDLVTFPARPPAPATPAIPSMPAMPGKRELCAWTVDDPAEAKRLLSLG